ncbi:MAG: DUF5777 family beta-barrel protein [Phaeodactylibacter xiamenensis]|uniref:DUF5777 domain-containing protein n=1 Tax=Phaeodactylibacter xiamenensis TaxID=1524460 RepID=A0A098RYL4_9BACT|nr:DUF5777 family beta-barrel protein [Phaeodactylibacter xiamenensis]KGE84936.1 hypothetical protein IX84_30870 [Phaeodactylibacter xiamenensis]MCR9052554.1 DUF5777 family beta-barrel protein [bacterium]
MKNISILIMLLVWMAPAAAQDVVTQTFNDSRLVNIQSVETLGKRRLDVRIGHRFGDLLGDNGGWSTFYGLEQASDVMIGAAYGATDKLTVGFFRTKGAGSLPNGQAGLRQVLNGTVKYALLRQGAMGGSPVSLTFWGVAALSTAERIPDNPDIIRNFSNFSHRMGYHGQLMIASRLSDRIALQVTPGYTHRNVVPFEDENGLFSLGVGTRLQISRVFGVIADVTLPFSDYRTTDNGFYPALGLGLEIDSGGHLFQLNFTNATGIMETDFIPYTTSNWLDGEFRFGFTISRLFNL